MSFFVILILLLLLFLILSMFLGHFEGEEERYPSADIL